MIAFTLNSLARFIEAGRVGGFDLPTTGSREVGDLLIVNQRGHQYALSVGQIDAEDGALILVSSESWQKFEHSSPEVKARFFERVHRAARAMASPPVSLPAQWSKYSYNNLVAFFALPRYLDADASRWIAERLDDGSTAFWRLTNSTRQSDLQGFRSDPELFSEVRRGYVEARLENLSRLFREPSGPGLIQPSVDLDRAGFGAVTRYRTYSQWIADMTEAQKSVLSSPAGQSLKIRGVAGTGKTLVLQLKALRELYERVSRDSAPGGSDFRVLMVTHSWALAQQIEESLRQLDEGDVWVQIEVMPLVFLREILQGSIPGEVEVLGEDSLDGKKRQLGLITEAIEYVKKNTWNSYVSNASKWIAQGVEGAPESDARITLGWALMREFVEVMDAYQLKPGVNSLKKYLRLARSSWMVPLASETDLEFAFAIYRIYVQRLVEEGQLTTDQMIDDFRRYLETYAWNVRRVSHGYDLVLVDEFHLFSDTERYLLHLLSRDPDSYPWIVMAMDPSQSTFALLTGLEDNEISRGASDLFDAGVITPINLNFVHRFTKPVFEFVQFVHKAMPNIVALGHDWKYDLNVLASSGVVGAKPRVKFASSGDLFAKAIDLSIGLVGEVDSNERVALLALGNVELQALIDEIARRPERGSFVVVEGREDMDRLRYSRRAIVVTGAEYAAGLQFSHVVIVVGSSNANEFGSGVSARRARISQFYLAASRAERGLHLVLPVDGDISDLAKKSVEAGITEVATG
jgi:hypothetical protein